MFFILYVNIYMVYKIMNFQFFLKNFKLLFNENAYLIIYYNPYFYNINNIFLNLFSNNKNL